LLSLVARQGAVVSADELLDEVWPGVIVTPDSVYQAVAALRRLLGDNPKDPRYIVTVPRQGYRMIAAVSALPTAIAADDAAPALDVSRDDDAPTTPPMTSSASLTPPRVPLRNRWRRMAIAAVVLLAIAGIVGGVGRWGRTTTPTIAAAKTDSESVAVLPFADLTDRMGEGEFTDGMTEELIDKVSHIPGVRVLPATASFWVKGKRMTVSEIATKLGVAYVLEGSVRKSGATMRVAARLVRADDGFVIWSQTYDRTSADRLMIQDDIANEVRKALETTIHRGVPGLARAAGARVPPSLLSFRCAALPRWQRYPPRLQS
jgi:TolB-like protein/DNA-binding winged helix-turn-helix (wHTH) protein